MDGGIFEEEEEEEEEEETASAVPRWAQRHRQRIPGATLPSDAWPPGPHPLDPLPLDLGSSNGFCSLGIETNPTRSTTASDPHFFFLKKKSLYGFSIFGPSSSYLQRSKRQVALKVFEGEGGGGGARAKKKIKEKRQPPETRRLCSFRGGR